MKIHFRDIKGKQAVYAEVEGLFYGRKSRRFQPDLPGNPISWGEISSSIKGKLLKFNLLDVTASNSATEGEVNFRIPDPRELWYAYDKEIWDKVYSKVEAEAWNNKEFKSLAQWWEYLRRSPKFRQECQQVRESLAGDTWLAWTAFAGLCPHAFHFGTSYVLKELGCLTHTVSPDAVHPAKYLGFKCYEKTVFFSGKWELSILEPFPYLWPEKATSQDLTASFLCMNSFATRNSSSEVCKKEGWDTVLTPRLFRKDKKSLRIKCQRNGKPGSWKNITFQIPCGYHKASELATFLFKKRLPVIQFDFISKLKPWKKSGIKFSVDASYDNDVVSSDKLPDSWLPILGYLFDHYHFEFLEFRTWSSQNYMDASIIQKETVSFDGNKNMDETLWPQSKKRSISSKKSNLKKEAGKRIARIENIAANRQQIAPYASTFWKKVRLEGYL